MKIPETVIVWCDESECNTPIAKVTTKGIEIEARHHGERHTRTITRDELLWILRYLDRIQASLAIR